MHSTKFASIKEISLIQINNSNDTAFHSALHRNPFQLKQIQINNSGENAKVSFKHAKTSGRKGRNTPMTIHKSTYEDMIDHCSYTHNLSSCKIKARKKIRPGWDSNQ